MTGSAIFFEDRLNVLFKSRRGDWNPRRGTVEGGEWKRLALTEDGIHPHQDARADPAQVTTFLLGTIAYIGVLLHHGKYGVAAGQTGQRIIHSVQQCDVGDTSQRIRVGRGRTRRFGLRAVGADRLQHARAEEQNGADWQRDSGKES